MIKFLFTITVFVFAAGPWAMECWAEEEALDIVSEGKRAIAIETNPPAYPKDALRRRIEGWVQLNYVVNPDGTTGEVEIVDSSVEGMFDAAAVKAVEQFKYTPAQWNGFPATDIVLGKRITFAITANNGEVGKDFYARFSAASDAIEENDFNKAQSFIKKLEARQKWLLAEVCYLDLLKGNYWNQRGDQTLALKFYDRALVVAEDYAKPEIYEILLRKAFTLNAATGNLPEALDSYAMLIQMDPDIPAEDPVHGLNDKIVAFVKGDTPYATAGTIGIRCESCSGISSAWSKKLLRKQFTLEVTEGEISEVKTLCGDAYVSFVFTADTAWDVDSRWGDCSVTVLGENGSTFRLLEL